MASLATPAEASGPTNFIKQIVEADLAAGKNGGRVVTRFPPEPNGYLHIGHAKSICLNFSLAQEFNGVCHLRFDDTDPAKESMEYVDSIQQDVRWLGFDWKEKRFFASDYFEALYEFARRLIRAEKAYVDHLSADQIRDHRGTLTAPGRNSPYRDRSVAENLDLFERMRAGEFKEGECVLRAKIDMAAPNIVLRDPTLYRIKHLEHYRTGRSWCIYPMYDFTHCLSDMLEGITHSICTLEFENNRALYDWVLDTLATPCHPQQIEFARLNLTYTVLSKRKLIELVERGIVGGWDDPRMPTISGYRRRGYTPEAIRAFCDRIGVARADSLVEIGLMEHCLREDLNRRAARAMAVLQPLKVTLVNYPQGRTEELEAVNNPGDAAMGTRRVPFGRELYIEREDFLEDPPKKFFRLAPGREVRLRYAYFIRCEEVVKDPVSGAVTELRCTYDPATRGGDAPDGRRVQGTLHWVSAAHAVRAEVRLYDHLFSRENPNDVEPGREFTDYINPNSLEVIRDARLEPGLATAAPGSRYQFERLGYFCADAADHRPDAPVFNRTATLKDTWAKIQKKGSRQ